MPAEKHSISRISLLVLFCAALFAPSALAQGGAGVRAGGSFDPDQFYFGGHLELGPVVDRLWFRPNIELGFGSDRTLVAINGEFAYFFPLRNRDWSLFVGAGPAINIISFDRDRFGNRDSEAEGGFNFLLGLSHFEGFFGELKVGALDSPELKLGVGYTFGRR